MFLSSTTRRASAARALPGAYGDKVMKKVFAAVTVATALAAGGAQAQHQGHDMSQMQHAAPGMQMSREQMMMHGGAAGPEYHAGMERMHQRMMERGMDRDPTRAWALMMIEHHQGAIDSSQTVLKYTRDAQARRLATMTIEENRKGQAELRSWLARNGGPNPQH